MSRRLIAAVALLSSACARSATPPSQELASERAVAFGVTPASQQVSEGAQAQWSGSLSFGQGSDGRPTRIEWDYDGNGTIDAAVCDEQPSTSCASHCSQSNVLGGGDFAASYVPTEALVADVDADGTDDFFVFHDDYYYGGSWTVFLATGVSVSGSDYYARGVPTLGDVDGDGAIDMIVSSTSQSSGSGVVYWGNGAGAFLQPSTAFSFGKSSNAIALGDLDGDGRNEIAADGNRIENVGGFPTELNGVRILTMTTSGTIVTRDTATGPFGLQSVGFMDFGDDGFLDVVAVSGNGGGYLRVYRGDGTGTVADSSDQFDISGPFQTYTSRLATGDVDGDGRDDVFVAVSDPYDYQTVISFYRGNGPSFAARQQWTVIGGIRRLEIVDLDADGDDDLFGIVATSGFFLRNDAGTFVSLGLPLPPSFAGGVGNFDGDGLPDIRGLGRGGNALLTGAGDGAFMQPHTRVNGSPRGMASGDLDGNGTLDLVTVSDPGGVTILANDGSGAFARTDHAHAGVAIAVAHLNTDASLDLVVGSATQLKVLLANTAGGYSVATTISESAFALVVEDFDEDGKADVASAGGSGLRLRRGAGNGTLLAPTSVSAAACSTGACALTAADFSRDANVDLVYAAGQSFTLHLGNGSGSFPSSGAYSVSSSTISEFHLASGDLTGDLHPDLVMTAVIPRASNGFSDPRDIAWVYRNTGSSPPLLFFDAITNDDAHRGVAIGDANADGASDVVLGNFWPSVFVRQPSGAFPDQPTLRRVAGEVPSRLLIADVDGDGWNDLATANRGSQSVSIIRGTPPNWACPMTRANYRTYAEVGTFTPRLDVVTSTGTQSQTFEVVVVDAVPTVSGFQAYDTAQFGAPKEGLSTTVRFYPSYNSADPIDRCEVDFGDQTSTVVDPCGSTVILQHVYADGDPTSYPVQITVHDEDSSNTLDFSVNVTNRAPVLVAVTAGTAVEGGTTSLGSSIADAIGDANWLVEWDFSYDGSFVADASSSVSMTGPFGTDHVFDEGAHVVAVRVTDQGGDAGSVSALRQVPIAVTDAQPALGVITPAAATVFEMAAVPLSVTVDATAFDVVSRCTWTFGDGSPAEEDPGCVGLVDGSTSLTHVFPDGDPTTFTVTVTVEDEDGVTAISRDVVVENAPPQTSASPAGTSAEGSAATVEVTITEAVDDAPYRIEWVWGDGTTDVTTHTATGTHSLSHTYPDDGAYPFVARVLDQTDAFGTPQTGSALVLTPTTVNVTNVPPALDPVPPQDAVEGSVFLLALTSTDAAGPDDPPQFSLDSAPSGVKLLSNGTLAWVPTYAQAGGGAGQSHSIAVSVADGDGGTDSGAFTVNVRWKDDDGDGMADTWESANGMDPTRDDSLEDADGDGIVNINEFNGNGPFTPNVVDPSSPAPAAQVVSKDPVLVVANTTDPDSSALVYVFEVFADAGLADRILQASAVGGTAGTTTLVVDDLTTDAGTDDDDPTNAVDAELEDDATYWWRARAYDGTYFGPWSVARSFDYQPVDDAPGFPAIAAPLSASHVSSTTPALQAGNSIDVDDAGLSYRFRVFADEAKTTMVRDSGAVAEGAYGTTSWIVTPALADDTWYWWTVSATDGASTTTTSGSFFVNVGNHEPSAPNAASPIGGAVVTAATVDLVATAATDPDGPSLTYLFEIDASPTFSTSARRASNLQTATTWTVSDLVEDTTYWWRVRAHDGLAAGDWSLESFRVNVANGAPYAPVAVGPVDQALIDDTTPRLRVRNAADPDGDAITYTFEVREGTEDGAVVATGTVSEHASGETEFTIAEEDALRTGVVHFWTATASDASGAASPPSTVAVFRVFEEPSRGGGCAVGSRQARSLAALAPFVFALLLAMRRKRMEVR